MKTHVNFPFYPAESSCTTFRRFSFFRSSVLILDSLFFYFLQWTACNHRFSSDAWRCSSFRCRSRTCSTPSVNNITVGLSQYRSRSGKKVRFDAFKQPSTRDVTDLELFERQLITTVLPHSNMVMNIVLSIKLEQSGQWRWSGDRQRKWPIDLFSAEAIERNQQLEFERNLEKLQLLKVGVLSKWQWRRLIDLLFQWSAAVFDRLSIVPPGMSVCPQVNLEYLAKLVISEQQHPDSSIRFVYPDTLIGTDAHTTLSNGFGVLSYSKCMEKQRRWSLSSLLIVRLEIDVGTIEAETAMFGQPIQIRLASVILGCRLIGQPHFMSTSGDLISALMKVRSSSCVNCWFLRGWQWSLFV